MRDKTIRAIGATVVLFGVAVAAIMQIGPGEASEAISLTPDQATVVGTPASDVDSSSSAATTTFPPFDYRGRGSCGDLNRQFLGVLWRASLGLELLHSWANQASPLHT